MPDYDRISYGDLTFQESHPGIISAIGSLTGLTPPAVKNCRVLELGCGTGFNLLAMSLSVPGGRFTGIDYAPAHIRRANEAANAIGAANVEFHCLSIDDFHGVPDSFDYIIAHGVYSWVPAATRDAILAIVRQCLSPHGLAYISYNTYPGWHLRSLVRDSLRFFADSASPRQAVGQLTQSLINPDSIYSRALRAEWADADAMPDYYLVHEHLVGNHPVFFREFVNHANTHQLQFAAEVNFFSNSFAQIETLRTQLQQAAGADRLQREQYLDWLVGRHFRRTLLCHAGHTLTGDPDPQSLLDMNIARNAEIQSEVTDEMYLEVIGQLDQAGAIPARRIDLAGMPPAFVAAVLWSGWRDGLWTIRADTPATTAAISERPVACPLARLQAAAGPDCTNRHHRRVLLTPEERQLIQTLDGSAAPTNNPVLARLAALALLISPAPATESAH